MKPYNKGYFGTGCIVKHKDKFVLGKGSTYNDYCWFNARYGITIGENTLLGPFVVIQTTNHVIKNIDIEQNANGIGSWCEKNPTARLKGDSVKIGNDVWIGANVVILAGTTIPNKCIIGAGTIITKSNSKLLKDGDIVVNDVKLRLLGNRKNYE